MLRTRAARLAGLTLVLASCVALRGSQMQGPKATSITESTLRKHMEFLAGDGLSGRGSGTRDEMLAAQYMGEQMKSWGIEPLGDNGGYVQQVAVGQPGQLRPFVPPTLTVKGEKFLAGRDVQMQGQGNGPTSGPLAMYVAGTPAPAGSFLLVAERLVPTPEELAPAGGVLSMPAPAGAGRRGGGNRGAATPGAPQPWRFGVTPETYAKLAATAPGTTVTVNVDLQPARTWNAVGKLTGSDPVMKDEVILLTAHLDHLGICALGGDYICNGADDDASGSTAVLALAEAIAKGPRPKRTVMFAWFGSEETGGAGNRHFLATPPVPLTSIVANVEFEMIGRADPTVPAHSLWLTGFERSDLGPTLAKQGALIVQDPHPTEQFFTRSDNYALARKGIVAHTVSSFNLHTDYHRASDEVKTIDFVHMTDSIHSMFAPVLWLSNTDFKPSWLPGLCPPPCGH